MKTKITTIDQVASTQAHVAPATPKGTTKPTPAKKATPQAARAATMATAKKAPATLPADGSKKSAVIGLISRRDGATLVEIMTATGWQKHTVRGFISILGKKGTKIESTKSESGARTYKAA